MHPRGKRCRFGLTSRIEKTSKSELTATDKHWNKAWIRLPPEWRANWPEGVQRHDNLLLRLVWRFDRLVGSERGGGGCRPQQRIGPVAPFLATDYAKLITGETVHVDAGYHIIG